MQHTAAPNGGVVGPPVRKGALEILPAKRQALFGGATLILTALVFDFLLYFATAPGHVLSRSPLLDAGWGYAHDGYEHTVTTHINRLRGAGYKMQESR